MMGLTSYLSFLSNNFSSYKVSVSLIESLTMMVLGPGHLVRALFNFPIKFLLVVSVEYFPLVVSVEHFPLVVSVDSSQLVESMKYCPKLVES